MHPRNMGESEFIKMGRKKFCINTLMTKVFERSVENCCVNWPKNLKASFYFQNFGLKMFLMSEKQQMGPKDNF